MLEPPTPTHKKKNDRDREKERLEKVLAIQFMKDYAHRQREKGHPENPREALKRTANSNWVHVTCAVWTPEIRFSKASNLEVAEGIARGPIPPASFELECGLCKTIRGACVSCHLCHANFHVACAHEAGHTFGFDITPVKSSRRDHVSTVALGAEFGYMAAAVWCKDHTTKTIVHPMHEPVTGSELNALQLFVRTYKQADLTYTGTVRKANLVSLFTRVTSPLTTSFASNQRRISSSGVLASNKGTRYNACEEDGTGKKEMATTTARSCVKCQVDVSPKWWPVAGQEMVIGGVVLRQIDIVDIPSARILPYNTGAVDGQARLVGANGYLPSTQLTNGDVHTAESMSINTAPTGRASRVGLSTGEEMFKQGAYQCHKCHWKEAHGVVSPESSPGCGNRMTILPAPSSEDGINYPAAIIPAAAPNSSLVALPSPTLQQHERPTDMNISQHRLATTLPPDPYPGQLMANGTVPTVNGSSSFSTNAPQQRPPLPPASSLNGHMHATLPKAASLPLSPHRSTSESRQEIFPLRRHVPAPILVQSSDAPSSGPATSAVGYPSRSPGTLSHLQGPALSNGVVQAPLPSVSGDMQKGVLPAAFAHHSRPSSVSPTALKQPQPQPHPQQLPNQFNTPLQLPLPPLTSPRLDVSQHQYQQQQQQQQERYPSAAGASVRVGSPKSGSTLAHESRKALSAVVVGSAASASPSLKNLLH